MYMLLVGCAELPDPCFCCAEGKTTVHAYLLWAKLRWSLFLSLIPSGCFRKKKKKNLLTVLFDKLLRMFLHACLLVTAKMRQGESR